MISQRVPQSLSQKMRAMKWGMVLVICSIFTIGITALYSAAGGAWEPWALRQFIRFWPGFGLMFLIGLTNIRFWLKWAYVLYGIVLFLLLLVEIKGRMGMGAQRWIDLKVFVLQPSELMKLTLILALARYYHGLPSKEVLFNRSLLVPFILIMMPVALVLLQPNLGTALLLLLASTALIFMAGTPAWKFGVVIGAFLVIAPIGWHFLYPYQKQRVYTFLDPSQDPLGAGYNIIQSKIALGSGGLFGKGFMEGTQSQLMFLPEKHTDFIFVVWCEEFGLVGGAFLLGLYIMLMAYGYKIAFHSQSQFGRLCAVGITTNFFLYVFINVAMVMGLIPVVGIPLPLMSYGGTSLMTLLMGAGLLLSVSVHSEARLSKSGN